MDTPPPKSEATTPATKPGTTPAQGTPAAPAATPPAGTLTADGTPIESRLLAYRALRRAAKEIGEEVAKAKPSRIVLYNEAEITAVGVYRAFVLQLKLLTDQVNAEVKDGRETLDALREARDDRAGRPEALGLTAVTGAVTAVGGLIRSVLDIVSLFRETVTLSFHDIAVADSALVAAVCGQLVYQKVPVYHPSMVPPGFGSAASAMSSDLEKLATARVDLDGVLKDIGTLKADLTAEIAEIDKELVSKPDDAVLKKRRAERQSRLTTATTLEQRLTSVAASVDAFRTALVKVDETTGASPLSRVLRAEKLAAIVADAHVLSLKVTGGSGALEIRQRVFPLSPERFYSGGAIVEFILFAPDGLIVNADTLPAYSGLVKVIEGRQSVDLTDIDSL